MHVYKELSFVGNKQSLDNLAKEIYDVFPVDWFRPKSNQRLKDYIRADYVGNQAPHAEVSIYYGKDYWRDGYNSKYFRGNVRYKGNSFTWGRTEIFYGTRGLIRKYKKRKKICIYI